MLESRSFAAYLLIFALGVLVGTQAERAARLPPHTPAAAEAATAPNRRPVAEESGAGDRSIGPLDLLEGPAYLAIRFQGNGTLRVRLVNERGEPTKPLGSPDGFIGGRLGPWKVRAVAPIESNGRYFLEVQGDEQWTVNITQ